LAIGKPKTGKTSFCALLAKKIDIVHIELEILINKSIARRKDYEENPPEVDDNG